MDIKVAIKWIESIAKADMNEQTDAACFNIINLLKRGEKFEQMFKEVEAVDSATEWDMLDLKEIRQKYFPKEICGFCNEYDSDNCYCMARGEFELYEEDTCDGWEGEN